jgi:predicted PurR-regulated permease PerM
LPPTPAGEGRRRSTLAVAAERSLQLLLIAAALAVAGFALVQLRLVVLTVLAALFLATALAPAARWLRRHRWPSALAALATIGAAGALLGGLLAAVAFAVAGELGDLGANARRGINEIVVWLTAGPLGLSERQIDDTLDRAVEQLRDRSDLIAGGLLALIEVPLVLPLMALTFLGAFVPLVGAIVAGSLAALIALVDQGPLAAIAWTIISYLRPKPSATSDRSRGHPDQLPPIRDPAATFP